jgi:DNA-binding NtrC family response regulator
VRDAQLLAGPAAARLGTGTLAEIERNAILRALEAAGGDKRAAAKALGISRAKIYQRLKEWGEASADEGAGEG